MGKIVYLANPRSPHVRQWLDLRVISGGVDIYHIGSALEVSDIYPSALPIAALYGPLRRLPSQLQYFILGVYLRFRLDKDTIIHAHNSSGYGIAAMVSGRTYIVTTYGSEIFCADKKFFVYRLLLRRVLRKAKFITATSLEMQDALLDIDSNLLEKICSFTLGVDRHFLTEKTALGYRNVQGRTWFVNRRIHPHYDTHRVIEGFRSFVQLGGGGKLVLLKGDADEAYLKRIAQMAYEVPNVEIIEKFLGKEEMIEILDRSDFCISVPRSDQLSTAILEGMSRGCVQILRPLKSYSRANIPAVYLRKDLALEEAIRLAFVETSELGDKDLRLQRRKVLIYMKRQFGFKKAVVEYQSILAKSGFCSSSTNDRRGN